MKDETSEFLITLPPGARVTFGPDVPFFKDPRTNRIIDDPYTQRAQGSKFALRVYADHTNNSLIACFPRVEWFRPEDMQVTRVYDGPDGMVIRAPDPPPPPARLPPGPLPPTGVRQQALRAAAIRHGYVGPEVVGGALPQATTGLAMALPGGGDPNATEADPDYGL
ncbi:MAG TPA: hypothetical protein VEI97_18780 [bacterium]|nr:hypothetical protein [bacterium]